MLEQIIPETLVFNLEQYLVYWGTSKEIMAKPSAGQIILGKLTAPHES